MSGAPRFNAAPLVLVKVKFTVKNAVTCVSLLQQHTAFLAEFDVDSYVWIYSHNPINAECAGNFLREYALNS